MIETIITFIIGAFTGGLTVHLFHIAFNKQSSLGIKSPNIMGNKNEVKIK